MNKFSRTLLRTAAFAALSTGLGMAQSGDQLKATIPFDFTVGKTTLPAGEYTICAARFGSSVWLIRDSQYRLQASVQTNTSSAPARPSESRLTFRVHGSKHYLASTWDAPMGAGRELPKSSAEREVEMATGPTTEVVLLARK